MVSAGFKLPRSNWRRVNTSGAHFIAVGLRHSLGDRATASGEATGPPWSEPAKPHLTGAAIIDHEEQGAQSDSVHRYDRRGHPFRGFSSSAIAAILYGRGRVTEGVQRDTSRLSAAVAEMVGKM